jgi:hypothetical protein
VGLRIFEEEAENSWIQEWPLPRRARFIGSKAYLTLKREVEGYMLDDARGRSMLIAGHRGSGKTTLALRVIDDVMRQLLAQAVTDALARGASEGMQPRRPLLVKLHGPSLLTASLPKLRDDSSSEESKEPDAPAPAAKKRSDDDDDDDDADDQADAQDSADEAAPEAEPDAITEGDREDAAAAGGQPARAGAAGENPPGKEDAGETQRPDARASKPAGGGPAAPPARKAQAKAPKPTDAAKPKNIEKQQVHAALVHITIALYRALAGEVAQSYTNHAREANRARPRGDQIDLAGQLTLELDKAPDPATLRAYWARLGRRRSGVLWPRVVGEKIADQGVREIIAVATAAQAFQVCSGAVTYRKTEKDSSAREATLTSTGTLNLKDAINGLFALLAAGLAGAGAIATRHGFGAAAAAAIATGLLSRLTLNWSSKRNLKNVSTLDYTFIVDRSIETLDRELPSVVNRIRDAGLAPIFVVDELDKLPDPNNTIGALIVRLKHIVADFGFFCFLTDRDYYEFIQHKLQSEAYPREHTYFSNLLFLTYRPQDIAAHLKSIMLPADLPSTDATPAELERTLLVQFIVHRAKLNITDLRREIAAMSDDGNRLAYQAGDLREHPFYKLPVMLQVAVDHLLKTPAMAARIDKAPYFAQLAADALYFISRCWERNEPGFDNRPEAVRAYLLERMLVRQPGAADARQRDEIGGPDLMILLEHIGILTDLLRDPQLMQRKLRKQPGLTAEGSILLDYIPDKLGPFLRPSGNDDLPYLFAFDAFGSERPAPGAQPERQDLDREILRLVRFVDSLGTALTMLSTDVPTLAANEIIPASTAWDVVQNNKRRLLDEFRGERRRRDVAAEIPIVRSFVNEIRARAGGLPLVVLLAYYVMRDAGPQATMAQAFAALARHINLRDVANITDAQAALTNLERYLHLRPDFPIDAAARLTAAMENESHWHAELRRARDGYAPVALGLDEAAIWKRWSDRLVAILLNGRPLIDPAGYDEVIFAAQDRLPSSLLRRDLDSLSALDWTELALKGFAARGSPTGAPQWAFVAALRALGFRGSVIAEAVRRVVDDAAARDAWTHDSGTDVQGIVLVVVQRDSLHPLKGYRGPPRLVIAREDLNDYEELIRWVWDKNALAGVVNERDSDEEV